MRKGVFGLLSQGAKKTPSFSKKKDAKKTPSIVQKDTKRTPSIIQKDAKKTPKKTQKTPIKDVKDTTYSKVKMKTQWTGNITVNVKRRKTKTPKRHQIDAFWRLFRKDAKASFVANTPFRMEGHKYIPLNILICCHPEVIQRPGLDVQQL